MRSGRHRDPLSVTVYLRRRLRRVLPAGLVMALATALLIGVLTPMNAFRETAAADVRPLESFTVVAPARRPAFDDSLRAWIARAPGLERVVSVRALWVRHPMIVGDAYCALLLGGAPEIAMLTTRLGLRVASGRLPDADHPGVALHEDVARARGLAIGQRFGSLSDPDDTTPGSYQIVGLLAGPGRIALGVTGTGLVEQFVLARVPGYQLVLSRPGAKPASDAYLRAMRDGDGPALQVTDERAMRARMDQALANLPVFVTFVSLALSLIVALVVALLQLVLFQSRADEHAILLVLGHRPARLVARAAGECAAIALIAWIAGAALALALLQAYSRWQFVPRGLLMRPFDAQPIVASLAVPIVAVGVAAVALRLQLGRMDPVDIVQRRGA
jgi:hypothetical protein